MAFIKVGQLLQKDIVVVHRFVVFITSLSDFRLWFLLLVLLEIEACILIVLSFIGKAGSFVASIPQVSVVGILCFMRTMLVALGFSNLKYSKLEAREI